MEAPKGFSSSFKSAAVATTGRTLSRRSTAGKCTPGEPPYGLRHLLQRGKPAQRSGLPQRAALGTREGGLLHRVGERGQTP